MFTIWKNPCIYFISRLTNMFIMTISSSSQQQPQNVSHQFHLSWMNRRRVTTIFLLDCDIDTNNMTDMWHSFASFIRYQLSLITVWVSLFWFRFRLRFRSEDKVIYAGALQPNSEGPFDVDRGVRGVGGDKVTLLLTLSGHNPCQIGRIVQLARLRRIINQNLTTDK